MSAVVDRAYGLGLSGIDPADLGGALATAALQLAREPSRAARAAAELALDETGIALATARRLLGASDDGAPPRKDARFADRAWTDNPFLRAVLESYLATADWSRRVVESVDVPDRTRRKARFALATLLDALAPSNVPWLNPMVAKEAIDTGGLSLVRGFANFVDDAVRNGGLPAQVGRTRFEVGRDLAATPGRVVFRNDLIELLAYEPVTDRVHAQPLLCCPPWINRYYVLDLAPRRSFIEYAVSRGFLVFAISYRNADASMAQVTLDDYLRESFLAALDAVRDVAQAPRVGVLGVCVGGTLATAGLAVLAARGAADRVASLTLVNTLVDYSDPGDVAVFIDEETIERIERRMAAKGYLSEDELSGPFTWMRGEALVWRYVVSRWYLGRDPAAFDIMAWNVDQTRQPAAMHSQFLRLCYLDNLLPAPRAAVLDGTPVDVSRIEAPVYVVGAETDHITPWRSSYRTTQLVGGEARYTLTASGHIAGIVRPPGSRGGFRARDDVPPDAEEWLHGATRRDGSWWEHWADWAAERAGGRVSVPTLPPGEPAPGRYVHT